jgi:transcriptional regulator
MYTPAHFAETRDEVLQALIATHRLATIVEVIDGAPVANHIPLLYRQLTPTSAVLQGHIARANPLWQTAHERGVLAIFQGPQAYITPSWYPAKKEHGKVVPTWNYCVVHVHGVLRAVEDPTWLHAHLRQMTDENEAPLPARWAVDDAPADFVNATMRGIVGIEIAVTRIQGKWKMSQNKSAADRRGIIEGLQQQPTAAALEVAALVPKPS